MPYKVVLQDEYTISVISEFSHGVNEIFTLLGCHAVLNGSYQCLGTIYQPHLHGSNILVLLSTPG
jgi:hypothetical protein